MGYYADLIKQKQEKRNGRSFKDIESAFRYVESKGYTIDRREWHKNHPRSWEWLPVTKDGKKDTIEFFVFSDGTIEVANSKEEKGYYAKLAEEKADKKNAKSWRVEFLGNSHYIETIADAESAQSKAQRDLAIKERQLSQQGEEIRQEYWEFSQQIRKIEKEIESQKKK